jgi:hypothetical protein
MFESTIKTRGLKYYDNITIPNWVCIRYGRE